MQYKLEVENIKCGGCANSIQKKIKQDHEVETVEVDVEQGVISVTSDQDLSSDILATLQQIGYPARDSVEGMEAITAKAKSFVSCAIGRMGKDGD